MIRLKNGKYVGGTKRGSKTIFIELVSENNAGLYFHKFFDSDLQRMLMSMNGNIYENFIFEIKYDKLKNQSAALTQYLKN